MAFLISLVSCIFIYMKAGGTPILNASEKMRCSLQSREDYLWSFVILSYVPSFLSGIAYKNRRLYTSTFLLFIAMLILLFFLVGEVLFLDLYYILFYLIYYLQKKQRNHFYLFFF